MTAKTSDRGANLLAIAALSLEQVAGGDYRTRRRGILFVATLLGHKMGPEQLTDQPWGTVGQCANCGQIGKTPREGAVIEGRAISTLCPAGAR